MEDYEGCDRPAPAGAAALLRRGVDRVTEDEVRDWWWTHPANLFADLPGRDGAPLRRTSDGDVVYLLCAARGHRRLAA